MKRGLLNRTMDQLTLPDVLFLLALHEDKGKVHPSIAMSLHYGLGGAILANLALLKMVEVDSKGKVLTLDAVPCEDSLLDESYNKIKESGKIFKTRHWIEEFSRHFRRLQKRISEKMVTQGVLKLDGQTYIWCIPYQAYPQLNASARYWIKQHIREILLADAPVVASDIAIINLVRACGMLQYVITRDEQKCARRKIDVLTAEKANDRTIVDVIEIINSAATTAAMIASIG